MRKLVLNYATALYLVSGSYCYVGTLQGRIRDDKRTHSVTNERAVTAHFPLLWSELGLMITFLAT
jgi:hypothetical protein